MDEYVKMAQRGITPWDQIPTLPDGLRGLEETRRIDLEDWMERLGLDAVIFPTVADVGPADADINPASADIAWSNGVWVANGNLAIRHLGVPTVTVPMGVMADIGMPVGLTFAGRAYDDSTLLRLASAFESIGSKRLIRRGHRRCRLDRLADSVLGLLRSPAVASSHGTNCNSMFLKYFSKSCNATQLDRYSRVARDLSPLGCAAAPKATTSILLAHRVVWLGAAAQPSGDKSSPQDLFPARQRSVGDAAGTPRHKSSARLHF